MYKKTLLILSSALALLTLSADAFAFPGYKSNIPSVDPRPNGCGSCHVNPMGRGTRTPFGLAFPGQSYTWSATLANMDSDGDGYTNGVEFGDPNGTWTAGMAATTWVSNAGIASDTPCGNGTIDAKVNGTEECDGTNFNNKTCSDFGHSSGMLSCKNDCTIDSSGCSSPPMCGNNMAEGMEACDGTDLKNQDCTTLGMGFKGGTLSCNGCMFDTTQCVSPRCGDMEIDVGEQCEGTNFQNNTCADFGGTMGTLSCDMNCQIDSSQCMRPTCGNGMLDKDMNEKCDGDKLDSMTCESLGMGFIGGTLSCSNMCDFDTSNCQSPMCGNAALEMGETCDGGELDGKTCETLGMDFTGGTLSCAMDCKSFDTSACTKDDCGNGMIDAGEDCDGMVLGGKTCADAGNFDGGTLACDSSCKFDTSACTAPMGMEDMGGMTDMGGETDMGMTETDMGTSDMKSGENNTENNNTNMDNMNTDGCVCSQATTPQNTPAAPLLLLIAGFLMGRNRRTRRSA